MLQSCGPHYEELLGVLHWPAMWDEWRSSMVTLAETRTAEIWLVDDGAEGDPIVLIRIRPDVQQSLDDARSNLDACTTAAADRPCCLLVDLRNAEPLPSEVRHYYTGGNLTRWFSAQALVVEGSAVGRAMGNLYLRIARPGIPTHIFSDEPSALRWLRAEVRE